METRIRLLLLEKISEKEEVYLSLNTTSDQELKQEYTAKYRVLDKEIAELLNQKED